MAINRALPSNLDPPDVVSRYFSLRAMPSLQKRHDDLDPVRLRRGCVVVFRGTAVPLTSSPVPFFVMMNRIESNRIESNGIKTNAATLYLVNVSNAHRKVVSPTQQRRTLFSLVRGHIGGWA